MSKSDDSSEEELPPSPNDAQLPSPSLGKIVLKLGIAFVRTARDYWSQRQDDQKCNSNPQGPLHQPEGWKEEKGRKYRVQNGPPTTPEVPVPRDDRSDSSDSSLTAESHPGPGDKRQYDLTSAYKEFRAAALQRAFSGFFTSTELAATNRLTDERVFAAMLNWERSFSHLQAHQLRNYWLALYQRYYHVRTLEVDRDIASSRHFAAARDLAGDWYAQLQRWGVRRIEDIGQVLIVSPEHGDRYDLCEDIPLKSQAKVVMPAWFLGEDIVEYGMLEIVQRGESAAPEKDKEA